MSYLQWRIVTKKACFGANLAIGTPQTNAIYILLLPTSPVPLACSGFRTHTNGSRLFKVITFCPAQLGHFRGVLNLSLGGDALVLPIRVIGEAPTVGTKQPR